MTGAFTKWIMLVMLSLALTGCYKTAEERAAEHFENGLALVAEGDLPRAIIEFRNTIKHDAVNLAAHRQLARTYESLGDLPASYAAYLRLVEQSPQDVEGLIALSAMAFEWQSWEEFDRHSSKLMAINSALPDAQAIALSVAYRDAVLSKDTPTRNAVVAQAETLALEIPANKVLQNLRIDTYVARRDLVAALAVLDQSIVQNPQDIQRYFAKLRLLYQVDDASAIDATMRALLDNFPDDQTAQETYLSYLVSRDRLSDAQAFLEQHLSSATAEGRNGAVVGLIAFLRETQGYDVALARLDAILEDEEASPHVLQTLRATLLFETGQRDQAIVALRDVIASDTLGMDNNDRANAQATLAQMLVAQGALDEARATVQTVLTADPRHATALKIQAQWFIDSDATSDAINNLRLVLEGNPDDAGAMVLMARAYQRAGNPDLQQNFLARAADTSDYAPRYALLLAQTLIEYGKPAQAETSLLSALRQDPENIELLEMLGGVYLQLNDLARGSQVARTLRNIETDAAQTKAQALFSELVARRAGVDQALAYLEQQAVKDGNSVATNMAIIQAQLNTGRVDAAVETAIRAVAAYPDNPSLRTALARSHAKAGDFPAAEAVFLALIDANPDVTEPYLQLAQMIAAQGDITGGSAVIDQGLSVLPDAADLLWAKASYLETLGDIPAAITIYETLYARNSGSAIIANNLASLLVSDRQDADSLAYAALIARRLNGTQIPAFQDTYGYIQFKNGNLQEALAYLAPAAAGLSGDPAVQLHLGEVYAALGRPQEAIEQMTIARDLSTDPAFRAKVGGQISQIETTMQKDERNGIGD